MTPHEEERLQRVLCKDCLRFVLQELCKPIPSWHKHTIDVRFDDGLEVLYCVTCREEW
jgi:hypothetical protein